MSDLKVYTARVSYGGPDRLDVTAQSADAEGKPFAPSWSLVHWGKRMLAEAAAKRDARLAEWAWRVYSYRYIGQMRVSYAQRRRAWDAMLARERVVLVCYCTDPEICHRTVLANIFEKLGAHNVGELPEAQQRRGAS